MSGELRVEFKMAVAGRRSVPKPDPQAKAKRQRQDRAARKARNLALAYWIDGLVRSGEIPDLAAAAKQCGVSRARLTQVVDLIGMSTAEQERALGRNGTSVR